MKDIIEKNLKIISDYQKETQELRYSTPIPQSVKEALIKLEQVLCEVTLNDSASLQTILNEFGVRCH